MTYTPLLVVTLAFVAVTGFFLQDSQSYDSLLSALSAMPDQAPLEDQPGYTSVLQRDLEGLVGSRVSRRFRRNSAENLICCGVGERLALLEEIGAKYSECRREFIKGCGEPDKRFTLGALFASLQCFATKLGVVDGEGYVLTAPFVEVVSNFYRKDSLKTLAKKVAPGCVAEANAYAKKKLAASDSEQTCNEAPFWAQYCVVWFLVLECPENLKIKNEQCDWTREQIKHIVQDWRNSMPSN